MPFRFSRLHQTVQVCTGVSSCHRVGKEPRFSARHEGPNRVFTQVVINTQPTTYNSQFGLLFRQVTQNPEGITWRRVSTTMTVFS